MEIDEQSDLGVNQPLVEESESPEVMRSPGEDSSDLEEMEDLEEMSDLDN
jgi:hypothetical protein